MKVNAKHILIFLIIISFSFLASYYIHGGKKDIIDGTSIGFFGNLVWYYCGILYSRFVFALSGDKGKFCD